ncbi:Gfo/Idh/MocA family oxidoreductase [Candidatus Pelagibacter sp.]|nr:Gfo/Idh/MocA family oxidoreductase [Candidatus Pelagibacter sp.]
MVNIGLIGAGRIAGHHIQAIKKFKSLKIVAICDLLLNKLENHKINNKVNKYNHYEEMLKSEKKIDLVVIMTPSGMHYEHAKKIITKYKKNIIIEKPICLKASQVTELYTLAKKNKVKVFPVFQNRYNKAIQFLKKKKTMDALGKLRIISVQVRWCRPQRYYDLADWRGTFSHDGGALTNQGIHHLDAMRYLCGELKKVNAKMSTLGANIEVEDSVVANFELKNGALGTLEITTSARPKDYNATISLVGSKGLAQIGGLALNELQIYSPDQKLCKINSEKIPTAYGFGHFSFYRDVKNYFTNSTKFPVSFDDCLKTINLLNSFYISDEIKNSVNPMNIKDSKRLGTKNEKISKKYR